MFPECRDYDVFREGATTVGLGKQRYSGPVRRPRHPVPSDLIKGLQLK